MKAIVAEGARFVYFTQQDPPWLETVLGLTVAFVPSFMEFRLSSATDFRLMLQRGLAANYPAFVFYLHWDNGQDLIELDQKVQAETFNDSDFAHSIKTVYQQTICDGCRTAWPTLVTPTGDPYDGAPGLAHRKIREHTFIQLCPKCGKRFRQLVAKIFVDDQLKGDIDPL